MLTDKVEFEKIISEKGVPDKIIMGDHSNFAFLRWQGDNFLLEVSNQLLVDSFLSDFAKDQIEYRNIYYKLYLYSLNTP